MSMSRQGPGPSWVAEGLLAALVAVACLIPLALLRGRALPWLDEVLFVDPAVNLLQGKGLTSTVWYYQGREEFYAGTPPLYVFLEYLWFRVGGWSTAHARDLSAILGLAAGTCLWAATRALGLVQAWRWRLVLVAVFMLGHGISEICWTARYDSLTLLLAVLVPLACCLREQWLRCVALALLGSLFPLSGIQLCVYAGLMGGVFLLLQGRRWLAEMVSLALGMIVGLAFLYLMLGATGVWTKFLLGMAGSQNTLTGRLAKGLLYGDFSGMRDYLKFPSIYFVDASMSVLLAAAAWIGFHARRADKGVKACGQFALVAGLAIPLLMFLLGKFPGYYSWAAFLPLSVGVVAALSRMEAGLGRQVGVGLLVLSAVVGVPMHVRQVMGDFEPAAVPAMEAMMARHLHPQDWVYADFEAYDVAKRHASLVFASTFGRTKVLPGVPEKERIAAIVATPGRFERALKDLGGRWEDTGDSAPIHKGDPDRLHLYLRR